MVPLPWAMIRSATELMLHLLETAQVPLHRGHRLLQVGLDLLILQRWHDLGLDLLDVGLVLVYLMLDKRLVEVAPGLALQLRRHGGTVCRTDVPPLSRCQIDV